MCSANRICVTLGQMIAMYEIENNGLLFPVGPPDPLNGGLPSTLGTTLPPHLRWPMVMFKVAGANPPPYDTAAYPPSPPATQFLQVMQDYPAAPYTPTMLVCPADYEPYKAHSYVLNEHLADKTIKAGTHNFGGLQPSEVIVAGEKVTTERDYYMEAGPVGTSGASEFDRVVEKYRHGVQLGSNYLYDDCHVDTKLPPDALTGIDPWDLKMTSPATQPS